MNNLDVLKNQLNDINNKRVRIQTLKEQAQKRCDEILKKYNVTSLKELTQRKEQIDKEYQEELTKAQEYVAQANEYFSKYQGLI